MTAGPRAVNAPNPRGDRKGEASRFHMTEPSDVHIALNDDPGEAARAIEANLMASLRGNMPPSDYVPLALVARDREGALVGGLLGGTSYGWLLVKALWVEDSRRGRGLGARLMGVAEDAALRRGCHGAWLDTSSARAKIFYDRLGYELFGLLENRPGEHPQDHSRFFLCKRLAPDGTRDPEPKERP